MIKNMQMMDVMIKTKISRKAQMQMGETVFSVFLIIIIIVLGLVVYSKVQEGAIKEKQAEVRAQRMISLSQQLASLPELDCSRGGVSQYNCVDKTKIILLAKLMNQSRSGNSSLADDYAFRYYFDMLKNAKLTIQEIYPGNASFSVYYNPGRTKNALPVSVPVNIYDPVSKTYSFGMMELVVYD